MKIIKFFIDDYRFTILVFLLLTMLGISSYLSMPRSENPNLTIPGATITAVYPGASPIDLEQLVAKPLEDEINELEDIKSIKTNLQEGIAIIRVEFIYGVDPEEKYDEVVQKVNKVRIVLPDDLYKLETSQWKSSDVAMYHLALVSEKISYAELQRRAEELDDKLNKNVNVRKVEILACPEQEVRISLDMGKMAQMNLSINDVSNAILSNNKNIPAGILKIGQKGFNVKTSGYYSSINEINNTIIAANKGNLVYLKDVADVNFEYEDMKYYARYNGKRAIFMTVLQKEGTNIFKLTRALNKPLREFSEKYSDLNVEYVFDQSNEVSAKVNRFQINLIQGILVVGFVILIMLGFRASMIVIMAIPLSLILAFTPIHFMGFGIQQMTIAGLVIALGLLVDNSIVVIENIQRFINMGYSARKASLKGTAELASPVISATITTVLAFIPMIMIPDKAGDFMKSMPLTVIFALIASLFIALGLTPLVASCSFKKKRKSPKGKYLALQPSFIEKRISGFISGTYTKILHYALKRRALIIISAVVVLAVSMGIFKNIEKSFFPKAEKPQFLVRIEMPEGSNLEYTLDVTKRIESVIDSIEQVKFYASNVGHGNPRIYYNVPEKSFNTQYAEIFVQLNSYNPDSFKKLITRLQERFCEYNVAKVYLKEFEQGPHSEAPVMIYIHGEDIDTLRKISLDVERMLSKQNGVINIENPLRDNITDLYFDINKEKAALYGVPVQNIDQTVRAAITGQKVSVFRNKYGEEFDIVLRLPEKDKIYLEDLDKIYVGSMLGKSIPLAQLARLEFKKAPGIITRYNLSRTAIVSAYLKGGVNLDKIMKNITAELNQYTFPDDYNYSLSGELEERGKSFGGMRIALIIALISVFMVLVLQFKSYSQPLIIYSTLPFAIIGMAWGLFFSGNPFSLTAFIGFISLVGIVINDSIILVSYANSQRREGKTIAQSLETACQTRFIPIILTSITTIGGILPLTLTGGSMWAPMGWTMMGGLSISTLLTLIIVPVLYSLFTKENNETVKPESKQ